MESPGKYPGQHGQQSEKVATLRRNILICIALIAVTFAVYWQVGNHEFLSYDDDVYIVSNPHVAQGITVANIVWAFTSVEQCNWHPVTWLSHMLDVQLYGMNPAGHHLTNVVFHTIAALILFLLLVRVTGAVWKSSFVAAMFALHPLHVESVAWAAERKDLLSACFFFLTLLLYARYVETRRNKAGSSVAIYLLTLLSFMLGLMSKPMLVTLPVIMLLCDFWPLRRLDTAPAPTLSSLVTEKIPFFACSLLSSAITIYAQREGGAIVVLDWVPIATRLQNSLVSYSRYLIKTLWPHDLAVLYPFTLSIPLWQVASSAVLLLLISVATIRAGRHYPYLPVGWFWFLITLFPVIGLIQVGNQSMADRYMYIPIIGILMMFAWGVPALLGAEQGVEDVAGRVKGNRWIREANRNTVLALLAVVTLGAATAVTWQQAGYWNNNFSLYQHALKVTADNYIIHYNLGVAYGRTGNLDAAINEFKAAVMIKPNDWSARNLLASTLAERGDIDAAIAELNTAVSIDPSNMAAKYSLEYWRNRKNSMK